MEERSHQPQNLRSLIQKEAVINSLALNQDVSLDFIVQGRRLGIPVVLLHGYTDSRRSYDRVLARLPASVNAIAVTQRGHGDSDRPASGYSPYDFAGDIVALLDKLHLQQAILLGH